MNTEEKAAYLAQYLGSEIEYPNIDSDLKSIVATLTGVSCGDGLETTYKRKKKGCCGDYLAFIDNGNHKCNALNAKILLTPLSAITDKDAIEVAKIYWGKTDFTSIDHTKRVLDSLIQKTDVVDYLRSKGYALPWKKYSVEQLIEMGWLKLKP